MPEILRLGVNLQGLSDRGQQLYLHHRPTFNGSAQAQSFSNKLLVLIDRRVYTPMFSGVCTGPAGCGGRDIDRIEVISGPRAT